MGLHVPFEQNSDKSGTATMVPSILPYSWFSRPISWLHRSCVLSKDHNHFIYVTKFIVYYIDKKFAIWANSSFSFYAI
jgi:hypothetical protein